MKAYLTTGHTPYERDIIAVVAANSEEEAIAYHRTNHPGDEDYYATEIPNVIVSDTITEVCELA